jgi:hypothetical protein
MAMLIETPNVFFGGTDRGLGLCDKASTVWPKVQVSLRAQRSNPCLNPEIASSLLAPRNDSPVSWVFSVARVLSHGP